MTGFYYILNMHLYDINFVLQLLQDKCIMSYIYPKITCHIQLSRWYMYQW